jgi:hypothetical protein
MTGDSKKGSLPPFSLRLSFEERAALERAAAGMSLSDYARSKLFGGGNDADRIERRARGKFPVKDHKALGAVLAQLGASRLSQNLNQLAKAANMGSLLVTPETENALRHAAAEVHDMRKLLLKALGLDGGSPA